MNDPWRCWPLYARDVLALAGADLARALPLGGVTPGGGGTGEPPAELLSRVARGDVARARAALRRLAGCSPSVTAGLAEILTPGMELTDAAARYACAHGHLGLRDALAAAVTREALARAALAASRTARSSRARRSLTDPAREALARLVEAREGALTDAVAGICAARGRLVTWGVTVLEGELGRYERAGMEDVA